MNREESFFSKWRYARRLIVTLPDSENDEVVTVDVHPVSESGDSVLSTARFVRSGCSERKGREGAGGLMMDNWRGKRFGASVGCPVVEQPSSASFQDVEFVGWTDRGVQCGAPFSS